MSETATETQPITAQGAVDPFWYAQGDAWKLELDRWDPERALYFETIFSIANGYMGFRGYREEIDNVFPAVREGYMGGMFSKLPPVARKLVVHDYEWDSRQMVSLPKIFGAFITLDGESFGIADGEIESYRQCLDMRNGVLTRTVKWTSNTGKTSILTFTRFLSASSPHLAVQNIQVEPVNWSGIVEIWWDYELTEKTVFRCGDPAKAHLPCAHFSVLETAASGAGVSGLVETVGSNHKISFSSEVSGPNVKSSCDDTGLLSQVVSDDVSEGNSVTWTRYTAVTSTRDNGVADPTAAGAAVLANALSEGYEGLLATQEQIWATRWKDADIKIDGPARDQVLVRFGIFSLLQIAPYHSDEQSIPARCFAYNRYNGLYFWDGEIFLLPFYQFCAPEVARNLLKFRCKTLPGARTNAALLNAKGAIFPWQGDADVGEEQAPWGLYEYLWHQNADIIYAFDQYARATGDVGFMTHDGLEVLAETARFWVSQFELGEDGLYHLDGTVGPDEAEEHGPDNGYTSLMARRSLEISHRWWTLAEANFADAAKSVASELSLGADEIAEWKAVAGKVCMPEVPDCPGVPLQDAFFLNRKPEDISNMTVAEFWERRNEVQVIKQADIVLAMFLLEDSFTREEIQRGYDFYEPKTLHVSSLSYNTHSIVAAIVGQKDVAYDYFHRAAGLDLDNLRNATKDGLHAAALGGVWQMAIPGFMGLRVREDHLFLQPSLPDAWNEITFPLFYRGWRLDVTAGNGRYRIEVSGEGQDAAEVRIGDDSSVLASGKTLEGSYES